MENRKKWTGWILIAVILVITGAALIMNTRAGSAAQPDNVLQQYEGTLRVLFPQTGVTTDVFEKISSDGGFIYRVRQAGGDKYAIQQTVQGYAGPIEVITAVSGDGVIEGIHVGGSEFRETEGLGGKAREEAFTDQFKNQKPPLELGTQIDAISGATVTSQAVTDAVNMALARLKEISDPSAAETPAAGTTVNASAIGYGGPVLVRMTVDDQGRIAALDVGGVRFAETEGVGSRVRDDDFVQRFIGLKPPLSLGSDVDALSGATVSSQAVVDAINDAAAFLEQNKAASDTN